MIRIYEHDGERIPVDLPDLAAHERYERHRSRLWKGMARLSRTSDGIVYYTKKQDAASPLHSLFLLLESL